MKIKLNKQHLQHNAGEEITVTPEQAEYFKKMGMVDEHHAEVKPPVHHKKHK